LNAVPIVQAGSPAECDGKLFVLGLLPVKVEAFEAP
jgi:hypothetical protein